MSTTSWECYRWQSGADRNRTGDLLNAMRFMGVRDGAPPCPSVQETEVSTPAPQTVADGHAPADRTRTAPAHHSTEAWASRGSGAVLTRPGGCPILNVGTVSAIVAS
jgi:hypothetical protein